MVSSQRLAVRTALVVAAAWAAGLSSPLRGDVFRWDNGQAIPGTQGITPGPGVNLSGLALSYANLAGINLTTSTFAGSTLQTAHFMSANLTGANLSSTSLFAADFTSAVLLSANATSSDLRASQLQSTASAITRDLRGISLAGDSQLTGLTLRTVNLTGASFASATLALADLTSSTLSGVSFTDADLSSANLSHTGLTAAQLKSSATGKGNTSAGFRGVDLSGDDLSGIDLSSRSLVLAVLQGTNFTQAYLASATFTNDDLSLANFTSADLTGANLAGTQLAGASLVGATISRANLSGAQNLTVSTLATTANAAVHDYSLVNFSRIGNLSGLSVPGFTLVSTFFASDDLTQANFTSSFVLAGDFTNANLTSANFAFADLRGSAGFNPVATTNLRGTVLPNLTLLPLALSAGEALTFQIGGTVAATGAITGGPTGGSIIVGALSAFTAPRIDVGVVSATGTLKLGPGSAPSAVASLSITGAGFVDISNGDLIVHNGSASALSAYVATWKGSPAAFLAGLGTTTTIAFTTVGVLSNNSGAGGAIYASFDGASVSATDVFVKFTYLGDTDLNGLVDGRDLANLVAGMNGHLTGWRNGDLNYDGVINGTDLQLLLSGLRGQGAPLLPGGVGPLPSASVPEPAVGLVAMAIPAFMIRRRRR